MSNFYLNTGSNEPLYIWFSQIPPPSDVGNKQIYPFTISLSSTYSGTHQIDLYSQYSNSSPYQVPQNKWSHLVPQWRFTDLDGNIINSLYIEGTANSASFYYIDDRATLEEEPVYLWATLQVSGFPVNVESQIFDIPGYTNSKIAIYLPYFIHEKKPTKLEITRNGIVSLSGFYWKNAHIPNVITINGTSYVSGWSFNTDNILMDLPISNAQGISSGVINKGIKKISASNQTWEAFDTNYFQKLDSDNLDIGGYNRQVVVPLVTASSTSISASVSSTYVAPYIDYTPFMWISNPDNGTINKIYYPKDKRNTTDIINWLEKDELKYNLQQVINAPLVTQMIGPYGLSGFAGIYGVAIDPYLNIWTTDPENDKVYKYDSKGTQLVSIDFGDASILPGVSGGCTPAGISIDKNLNIWVTLFDSASIFNFDSLGTYITSINLSDNDSMYTDPHFKPVLAEVNSTNTKLFTTFSNPLCSVIKRYLLPYNDNNAVAEKILPTCSCPMDLLFDKNGFLWTSLTYNSGPPYLMGNILKYTVTHPVHITLTYTVSISNPSYLTYDLKNDNIWFTYGFDEVGYINATTYTTVTGIHIGNIPLSTVWFDTTARLDYSCLEGIACDRDSRIWVIHSIENKAYVLSADGTPITSFTIQPCSHSIYYNLTGGVEIEHDDWAKSAQSFGDWSGLKWYTKYQNTILDTSTTTVKLTGESQFFDIEDYVNYDIRRFNESWDATKHIRDLALPEHDYENYNLFENVIGSIVGSISSNETELMRPMYEKIANFVINHQDIDACNMEQLYSLADELHVPVDNYVFGYPTELRRLMDIFSVNFNKLKGSRCKCNHNFSNSEVCNNCEHTHTPNLGPLFDFTQYTTIAGVPFVVRNKWYNNSPYEIITPTSAMSLSTMPSISILVTPNDYVDYYFYTYISTTCDTQIEGIINWDDQFTTLSENITSIEDWYGEGKTVEKIINYNLYKGLGLLE